MLIQGVKQKDNAGLIFIRILRKNNKPASTFHFYLIESIESYQLSKQSIRSINSLNFLGE